MFTHVPFVWSHTLLCTGNGVLTLLFIPIRQDLYYAQSSMVPGCPDIPVNPQWGSRLRKGTNYILFSKRQQKDITWDKISLDKLHVSGQIRTSYYERTWIWTPWHVDTSHCDFISRNCGLISHVISCYLDITSQNCDTRGLQIGWLLGHKWRITGKRTFECQK